MITSTENSKGIIDAGDTELACTITVEQTGPMQLTIKAGTYTHPDGQMFTLASDEVVNIVSDPTYPVIYRAALGLLNGVFNIWFCGWFRGDVSSMDKGRAYWQRLAWLMVDFVVPPGTTDLSTLNIYVLKVVRTEKAIP